MEYRYIIWNDLKREYQFPRICETTEKGANTLLFKLIGNDARKDRFKIVKEEKEKAKTIVRELKQKYKAEKIHRELPNIEFTEILELVKKNAETNNEWKGGYYDKFKKKLCKLI